MAVPKCHVAQLWISVIAFLGIIYRDWVHHLHLYHHSLNEPTLTASALTAPTLTASVDHQDESRHAFEPTVKKPVSKKKKPTKQERKEETVCADWHTNMDSWWQHHPDWEISEETATGYCFSPIQHKEKAEFFRQLYYIQYTGDCSNVRTVEIESTGYGETFNLVDAALLYAYENNQPVSFHPRKGRWHYAAKKDASTPVCPRKDMSCYFLNVTSCQANLDKIEKPKKPKGDFSVNSRKGRWIYEYATRGQTWLRREVYKLSSTTELVTPCTVMHVRRTDAVLEKGKHRKYHAIQEYVDGAGTDLTDNIFLLTDDQNAIEEAITEFPQYNWMYMDRPRYRGTEGGFEAHIPSDDPKFEVIVILSTFKLVKHCETFVHARSRFATQIRSNMLDAKAIDLDYGKQVYNDSNDKTVVISKSYLRKQSPFFSGWIR